ncbi:MAG TPA: TolC family protein [Gemmatimonadales bacterium]|nr:TolC family protein [Gemmatimonadales bacterium]
MRRVLRSVLVGSVLAAPLPGQAASDQLTIDALYRTVDSLNPRIGAARAAADAALARVPGNRRLPDPRLQFATMNRELPGFELQDPLGMNQVQLTQMFPIPGTGKLGLAGDVAQSRADAEQAWVGESVWEQRSRAAMAFYDLYRTEATLAVMRENIRLLEAIASTVSGMYAVGEARQADVLRAQLEVGRMTGQIAEMTAMRRTMVARLNTVLNRPPDAPTGAPVLPLFPDTIPSVDSLTALALASRGMLLAGADQLRAATAAEQLARRDIWPDLELGVIYGRQPMQGGGTDQMLSIMLGASVPIWAGSRQLKMRDETAAMRRMAEDDLAAMRADTRGRVAELVAEVVRARELHALYQRTLLPQADATVASARAAYQVGNVDFMTYIDALMTAYGYRTEIHRLDAQEGQALAELEMVTAHPLVTTIVDAGVTAPGGAP